MSTNSFVFKQFEVLQKQSAMKVGTDGVLLGAWVDVSNADRILDVGTGTGLIALMMAQRSTAKITGLDTHPESIEEAKINVRNSPWRDRIDMQLSSFQEFVSLKNSPSYDLVVSNPPFYQNALLPPDKNRALARHTIQLSSFDLISCCSRVLTEKGILALIYPAEYYEELLDTSGKFGFYPRRVLFVYPTPGSAVKRVLIEFIRTKGELLIESLVIEIKRHQYSKEYRDLTKEFYLRF